MCLNAILLTTTDALFGVPNEVDIRFHYDVVFASHPLSPEEVLRIPVGRLYPMRQMNGSSYICELPPTEEEFIAEKMAEHRAQWESGAADSPRFRLGDVLPLSVTRPIHNQIASGGPIVARKGYWTYVLDLGKYVRQEHEYQVRDTQETGRMEFRILTTDIFVMGMDIHEWARTKAAAGQGDERIAQLRRGETRYTLQRDHEGAYLSSLYPKGDECDLTHGSRQAEVQLRCLEHGDFATTVTMDIQEAGTCMYVVKLYDRRACVPGLLERPVRQLSIVCHPLAVVSRRDGE